MLKAYVMSDPAPNAFAIGRNARSAPGGSSGSRGGGSFGGGFGGESW